MTKVNPISEFFINMLYLPQFLKQNANKVLNDETSDKNKTTEEADKESSLDVQKEGTAFVVTNTNSLIPENSFVALFASWLKSFFSWNSTGGSDGSNFPSTGDSDVTTGPTKYENGVLTFKNDTTVEVPDGADVKRKADGSATVKYSKDSVDYSYTYNANGLKTQEIVKNSNVTTTTDYEYNEYNTVSSLTEKTEYSDKSYQVVSKTYDYNETQKTSSLTSYNKKGEQIFKFANNGIGSGIKYSLNKSAENTVINSGTIYFTNGKSFEVPEGSSVTINSDGTVTVLNNSPQDADLKSVVTIFDKKGRTIEEVATLKAGGTRIQKIKYDTQGNVISTSKTDENGKTTTEENIQTINGMKCVDTTIKEGNKTISKHYTTDKKGNVVEVIETYENGKCTKEETTFDKKNGNRKSGTVITNSDGSTNTITYTYNKDGTLKTEKNKYKTADNKTSTTTASYKYDSKSNVSEVVVKNGEKKITYTVSNQYDSEGKLIQKRISNSTNNATKTISYDWENLDDSGNPTQIVEEKPVVDLANKRIIFGTGEIADLRNAEDYTINDDGSVTITDADGNTYLYKSTDSFKYIAK